MEMDRLGDSEPTVENASGLQDEQENVSSSGHRSVKKRWAYVPAEEEPAQSTEDLGSKWGCSDLQEDNGGRWTRATRKRMTRVSVAVGEDGGRLSRRFADLNHHFGRNPGELVVQGPTARTDSDEEEEVKSSLSGGLTAEPDCLRGNLTAGVSRLRGGLMTSNSTDHFVADVEGESLALEIGRAENRHGLSSHKRAMEGEALKIFRMVGTPHPNKIYRSPEINRRTVGFPSWFEEYELDMEPVTSPPLKTPRRPKERIPTVPTALPVIDSGDEESLMDELNEHFD
jgi:hypothetical protein